jgi:hypothetical protein
MVELPSSEKLTTRCPIRVEMKRADERTAHVSVQWKSKPRDKTSEELAFNESVGNANWSSVTSHIANAQEHIMKLAGKHAANAISRDIVVVKVAGPHYVLD